MIKISLHLKEIADRKTPSKNPYVFHCEDYTTITTSYLEKDAFLNEYRKLYTRAQLKELVFVLPPRYTSIASTILLHHWSAS